MEEGATPTDATLQPASCELAATRPAMFFGLPRKLSSLIIFFVVMAVLLLDDVTSWIAAVVCGGMAWFAVREAVSADLWSFEVWVAWLFTDFRFLDAGGRDGWGGARFAALPLHPATPPGVTGRAD